MRVLGLATTEVVGVADGMLESFEGVLVEPQVRNDEGMREVVRGSARVVQARCVVPMGLVSL